MPDLSSVAREAAEARAYDLAPDVDRGIVGDVLVNRERESLRLAYVRGFTECASRIPSASELTHAIAGGLVDGDPRSAAEAVLALIGEKISVKY